MGKKARPPLKEKRVAGYSPKIVPEQEHLNVEIVDGVTAVKERKLCSHFEKGFDANQLSEKIRSLDSFRCGDCREGVGGRKGAKGRAKLAKKGSGSVDSKSESKAIWVCLECGHLACGGVGLPTTAQSHAVRHSKQSRHPLVFQWENPQLQWCFPCNKLIPAVKTEGNGEKKDSVSEVVKMIKAQSFKQSSVDAMDVWTGRGSILSELNAEGNGATSLEGRSGHVVRGLVNLGNTCFFNSVMQNLLSMNKLRDYFLNEEASLGPLSIALKKLFTDLKAEASLRNAINPKSFFGSVCSNAPQFRGYQQQDSHELLRCLLDGLSNEELIVRKRKNASDEDDIPPKHGPMFVDSAFGGQISSTVCCVECGHSSTIHEPFLDLSLPVPMKKPPIKKVQPVSRAKKTKLTPKRGGKVQPKVKKSMVSVPAQNNSNPSVHSESSCQTQSSSDNTLAPDSNVSSTVVNASGIASQNLMAGVESDSKQAVDIAMKQTTSSFEDFWMDYVGTENSSDEHDLTSENIDLEAGPQCGDKFVIPNDGLMEACQGPSIDREPNKKPESSSVNPWEEEVPLQAQSASGIASQNLMAGVESDSKQAVDTAMKQTASSFGDFWMDYVGTETSSDEHDLTSENIDLEAGQQCGDKFVIPNDGLMEACQGPSIDREPNKKPESSSVNHWEEEVPLQAQSASGIASQNLMAGVESDSKQAVDTAMKQTASSFGDFWMDYVGTETSSDEHDLTSENIDLEAGQQCGDKFVIPNDGLMEACQGPSIDREPNQKPESSSVNPWEEEVPLQAQSASGIASQNLMAGVESDSKQAVDTAMKQTASSFGDFWMDYVGTETSSDEHDLTSENIDLEARQQCGDKFVIPNDGLMEACQGPSIDREPNQKPESSSFNPWEEEVPLQAQSASGIASQNLMAGVESDSKQAVDTAMKQTASSFGDFWMDYVGTETSSDEHDLTSENIDLEAGQQCGDKFVIPNDGLMEACQGPSIDREPNQKPESSSVNPWEEEVPLQAQSASGIASQNLMAGVESDSKQAVDTAMKQTASSFGDFWMDYVGTENSSDEHDLTSENIDLEAGQQCGDKFVIPNDGLMEACQGPSIDREPNQKPESSSVNPREEEVPLQAQSASGIASQNLMAGVESDSKQAVDTAMKQTASSFGDFWMDYVGTETSSDEHDLTSENIDLEAGQQCGDKFVIPNDGLMEACQGPSIDREPNKKPESSSVNHWEEEVPLQAQSACGIASQNLMAGVESDSKQAVDTAMKQTASSFGDFWMDYVGTETSSDEHDLTSKNIDLEAGQQYGDKFVIPNDGLMEACQGPSIDREPNQKPESSSVNHWEDEVPLQAQSSEVLLLDREEGFTDGEIMKGEAESSSSFVGCEQDEAGFDGIGDLFNEPEVSTAPVAGPSLPNEVAGPVFIAGVSSESDPDEVDDTESPVSIESCLSHFVKPELLSNDNAWECENCSKILGQQRLDAKKKQAKISSNFLLNGGETQIQSESVSLDKDISYATEVINFHNGDGNPNNLLSSTPEVFVSGKNSSNKKFIQAEIVQTEMEPFISPSEERKYEMNVSHSSGYYESCNGETLSGPPADSCSVDETSDTGYNMAKDEQIDSNFSGNCESDINEDEDKTSKHVNVKRDATKRVLIDRAPPILTIHLKRFSQDARGRLCKLNGHVTFRDVLDVGPYMDPRCVDTESYVYRLLGVVEHLGTMRGGHYIAYVRGDKRNQGKGDEEHGGSVWYYASDAHVREVSLEEVLRCDAYLLFYEKV